MRIGLLASGGLGVTLSKYLREHYGLAFVMTDKRSSDIINYCHDYGIPCFIGNPRNGRTQRFTQDKPIDVLLSVNYLFLIEKDLIQLPLRLAFNVHGSLLPKYRGRTPHVWAIINNESESGITAHLIDSGCDTGEVIEQMSVPIEVNDTGADVLAKFQLLYIPLIEKVLLQVIEVQISTIPQEHSKATIFGKRTPEDGRINWNWQKERIRNWVRAQSYPYPGAFSIYDANKLIIDEINYDDFGYVGTDPNGLILSTKPLRIKTPNGAVLLDSVREHDFELKRGGILE